MLTLPQRSGVKPTTTANAPHEQLDQNSPVEIYELLKERAFELPFVERRPSAISVPGAEALWLSEDKDRSCDQAFMIGNEFAHVHPPHDGSLHMMLPRAHARDVVQKGWGEMHPMVALGFVPPNAVMIFGPRDSIELGLVLDIVGASHGFALGETGDD